MSEEDKAKVAKEKKTKIVAKKATVSQCYTHAKRVAMLTGANYEEIKDKPENWQCGMKAGEVGKEKAVSSKRSSRRRRR